MSTPTSIPIDVHGRVGLPDLMTREESKQMYRVICRVAELCSGHSFHTFKAILEAARPFMPDVGKKGETTTPNFTNSVGEFVLCFPSYMGTGATSEITWYQTAFRKLGYTEYASMRALQDSRTLIELYCNLLLLFVSVVGRLSTMKDKTKMKDLFNEYGSASVHCALKELMLCATSGRVDFRRMTRYLRLPVVRNGEFSEWIGFDQAHVSLFMQAANCSVPTGNVELIHMQGEDDAMGNLSWENLGSFVRLNLQAVFARFVHYINRQRRRRHVTAMKRVDAFDDYKNRMSRKAMSTNKPLTAEQLGRVAEDVKLDRFLRPETHFSTHYGLKDPWEKVVMENQKLSGGNKCFMQDYWKLRPVPLKKIKKEESDLESDHDSFSEHEGGEEKEVERRGKAMKRREMEMDVVRQDDESSGEDDEHEKRNENAIFLNEYKPERGFPVDDQGDLRRERVQKAQEDSLNWERSGFDDFESREDRILSMDKDEVAVDDEFGGNLSIDFDMLENGSDQMDPTEMAAGTPQSSMSDMHLPPTNPAGPNSRSPATSAAAGEKKKEVISHMKEKKMKMVDDEDEEKPKTLKDILDEEMEKLAHLEEKKIVRAKEVGKVKRRKGVSEGPAPAEKEGGEKKKKGTSKKKADQNTIASPKRARRANTLPREVKKIPKGKETEARKDPTVQSPLNCRRCSFSTLSAAGFIAHLKGMHSTTLLQQGLLLRCSGGVYVRDEEEERAHREFSAAASQLDGERDSALEWPLIYEIVDVGSLAAKKKESIECNGGSERPKRAANRRRKRYSPSFSDFSE